MAQQTFLRVSAMKIYTIKFVIRGVSPMIWRRFKIQGNTSLADLHHIIQVAYNWDNEYLHQFHIYGEDYGLSYDGGIVFADNARKVTLDNFEFDVGDKFTYEYNFFDHWLVDIRIEAIDKSDMPAMFSCIKGNGVFGVTQSDENRCLFEIIEMIAKYNKSKSQDSKIVSLIEELRAMRFKHHVINQSLEEAFSAQKVV